MESSVQLFAELSNQLAKLKSDVKVPVFEKLTTEDPRRHPAHTTATFFRGDPATAAKALRARLGEIVKKNPWLACRLIRSNNADANGLFMVYSAKVNDEDPCQFGETSLFNPTKQCGKEPKKKVEVHSKMGLAELFLAVSDSVAEIPTGLQSLSEDKEQPQMALTVVPDAQRPTDTFCVIFSFSHIIADGFTYYRVLTMLSNDEDIESLSATRKHDIVDKKKIAIGPQELLTVRRGMLSRMLLPQKKPLITSYYIDPAKINEAKKAVASVVGRTSTNDVLVSTIAKAFESRFFMMAMNLRDRLPGFTETDAGNYEGLLVFCPEDYANPGLIRQTLKSAPPTFHRQGNAKLPGFWETIRCNFGVLTNEAFPWFKDVKIAGCTQMLHLPILKVGIVPNKAVVYRPRAEELAVTFLTRSLDRAGIEEKCLVGGRVTCAEDAVTRGMSGLSRL